MNIAGRRPGPAGRDDLLSIGALIVTTTRFAEPIETDNPAGLRLSELAAAKVKELLQGQEQSAGLRLRVAVQPGGCSGLRYQLFFDDESAEGDLVSGYDGFEVVVDAVSGPFLSEATIDFAERGDAQGFTIDNPNARSSCGSSCGDGEGFGGSCGGGSCR
ncbi:MAG: iron-sulfur cluster assembly accessory protein [Micromonosporaceae bacterium]|nr:iron-sulfur cluster assembly accessory protein [Micromonosporaceae bacterium]